MLIILVACGSDTSDTESAQDSVELNSTESSSGSVEDFGFTMEHIESDEAVEVEREIGDAEASENNPERKVVYTAHLQIEVKNLQETFNQIQSEVEKYKGYIVDSTMFEEPDSASKHGHITVRIPVDHFTTFVHFVEEGSSKVLESSTSGQDVTEEYVDLESRLKSKRMVEERLLSFMEEAEKTEDLLKISNDLAKVQEEIEEIIGRMNYLQNQSDLATVSIYMQEKDLSLTGTGKDDLNTWEKTQQQFMKSINFIISAFSTIIIYVIGNIPVILFIALIVVIVYLIVRKNKKKLKSNIKKEVVNSEQENINSEKQE